MEIAQATMNNNLNTNQPKSSSSPEEHGIETPTRIQNPTTPTTTTKALGFSNGVLKRLHSYHHVAAVTNHHHQVAYKECLKNHAAALGGHALDGCGEFMPAPTATAADPTSLKCAACGCHRNFHRREPEDPLVTAAIEFQSHHRHQPLPPPPLPRSPSSPSPPPISSSYFPHHHHQHQHPSAPHMLLALSSAGIPAPPESTAGPVITTGIMASPRKRFRTKFSQDQKEKMLKFAERVAWKMQKKDEDSVREFCGEIGVDRGVLKVWMHNNKNNFAAKRENHHPDGGAAMNGNGKSILKEDPNINNVVNGGDNHGVNVVANGSSTSS